jgi:hypothetical protein
MALIIKETPQVPPKPELATVVEQLKKINTEMYKQMKMLHTRAFMHVWNNPHYKPEEIVGAFGNEGAALFSLSAGVQQILKTADPDYKLMLPNQPVTVNPDGTVTFNKVEDLVE